MRKISILVASEREGDRREIAALLAIQGDFVVSKVVECGYGLITSAELLRPDVVVMDFQLEGYDCLKLAPIVKRRSPATAIVALCSPGKKSVALDRVLKAGISGCLLWREDFSCLPLAARCVFNKGLYISEAARMQVVDCFSATGIMSQPGKGASPRAAFTATELQIFRGIILGHSDDKIAENLNLNTGTVSNCVCHAKRKAGLHNRTQLSIYALHAGQLFLEDGFPWEAVDAPGKGFGGLKGSANKLGAN